MDNFFNTLAWVFIISWLCHGCSFDKTVNDIGKSVREIQTEFNKGYYESVK